MYNIENGYEVHGHHTFFSMYGVVVTIIVHLGEMDTILD